MFSFVYKYYRFYIVETRSLNLSIRPQLIVGCLVQESFMTIMADTQIIQGYGIIQSYHELVVVLVIRIKNRSLLMESEEFLKLLDGVVFGPAPTFLEPIPSVSPMYSESVLSGPFYFDPVL